MATCFVNVPPDIRELRVRADAALVSIRSWKSSSQTFAIYSGGSPDSGLQAIAPACDMNPSTASGKWRTSSIVHMVPQARRSSWHDDSFQKRNRKPRSFIWALRLSRLGNQYGPDAGRVWHFYDGHAGMEPRIGELREILRSARSHRLVCGKCALPGNHSACVQSGHSVPTQAAWKNLGTT